MEMRVISRVNFQEYPDDHRQLGLGQQLLDFAVSLAEYELKRHPYI